MQVVAIKDVAEVSIPKAQAVAKALETQIFTEINKETFKNRPSKSTKKGKGSEREIVFEGPSEKEVNKYSGEQSRNLVDSQGRHRWIVTRECWCSHNDPNECKIRPDTNECPSAPKYKVTDRFPRRLWATNPDYGKPPVEQPELEEAQVVEVTQ